MGEVIFFFDDRIEEPIPSSDRRLCDILNVNEIWN